MKSLKPKTYTVLFIFTAGIIVSVAATKPSVKTTTQTVISTNDTGLFKNLQVLPKDISKDSLNKIMHNFSMSLGVHCNFCHAMVNGKPDFASDEKEEKGIARYMMRMTTSIDSAYFNFEKSTMPDTINVIKCVTCHRGNPHPDQAMNNNNGQNNAPQGTPPNGQMAPPPQGTDSSRHN